MPNIKSAIKRVELGKIRMIKNAAAKSFLKTVIRRFEESITTDSETSALALKKATVALDRASSKGLIHKNLSARKKSRLTSRFVKAFAKVG